MNTYLFNGHVVTASNKKEVLNPKRVVAEDKWHLKDLIDEAIDKYGNECDLNFIDVSNVESMSYMFYDSEFNGDISKWNVSNVENMDGMFCKSNFDGDISKWDVSNVGTMYRMFESSKFNGDISKWDVSNVKYMDCMFEDSKFNGDISKWIPMMKKNGIDFKDLDLPIKSDTWSDIEV
jgi:surface protein